MESWPNHIKWQRLTRQGCLLSTLLLALEIFNRNVRHKERIETVKIKGEYYKLRAFADDLMLGLENPLKGIEILMTKLKAFGAVNRRRKWKQDETKLINNPGFKIEKRINIWISLWQIWMLYYFKIIMSKFGMKFKKVCRWGNVQVSLLDRISVIKIVLPRMLFLF